MYRRELYSRNRQRRLAIFLMWSLFLFAKCPEAFSEIADKAPLASEWAPRFLADSKKQALVKAPKVLTFVESFTSDDPVRGKPLFLDFSLEECQAFAYFECVDAKSALFTQQINGTGNFPGAKGAMILTRADTVVFATKKGVFVSIAGSNPIALGLNQETLKGKSITKIFEKIFQVAAYDGVVLDTDGPNILVGSFKNRFEQKDLQGLVIRNSAGSYVLNATTRTGVSLIYLQNTWRGFAVFMEYANTNQLRAVPGSKVILESSASAPTNQ